MTFIGRKNFQHSQQPSIGVLITNLGTPSEPNRKGLRRYLAEFLADNRVVELSRWLWFPILHGIILNTRPSKSAQLYQSVWTENGSPLLANTIAQADLLKERLKNEVPANVDVDYAMRYGEPSIAQRIDRMLSQGVEKLLVLPLYPQYAGSTVGSTFDAVATALQQKRWVPELRFVNCYHDHPGYIKACAARISEHWETRQKQEVLILSFHGLPKAHLDNGDPYFCQCHKTARLIAESLGLQQDEYRVTFQSRFGRQEWLKPYTDATLVELAKSGVESVEVFCPGFSADCLETLEEIAVENRNYFMEAGGKSYTYIPALNDSSAHIDLLVELVAGQCKDWSSQLRDASVSEQNYISLKT